MKIIFTLTVLFALSTTARPVNNASFTKNGFGAKPANAEKNAICIVSNRETGDMQLRFKADKEGEAIITILDGSGKIMLQQTSQVTNSINTIPLKNATGLAEGSYTLRLISNNETYTARFLIWK